MHSMMGTLEGRGAWFAQLAAACVPTFGDSEDMVTAAGILARSRRLRATLD